MGHEATQRARMGSPGYHCPECHIPTALGITKISINGGLTAQGSLLVPSGSLVKPRSAACSCPELSAEHKPSAPLPPSSQAGKPQLTSAQPLYKGSALIRLPQVLNTNEVQLLLGQPRALSQPWGVPKRPQFPFPSDRSPFWLMGEKALDVPREFKARHRWEPPDLEYLYIFFWGGTVLASDFWQKNVQSATEHAVEAVTNPSWRKCAWGRPGTPWHCLAFRSRHWTPAGTLHPQPPSPQTPTAINLKPPLGITTGNLNKITRITKIYLKKNKKKLDVMFCF